MTRALFVLSLLCEGFKLCEEKMRKSYETNLIQITRVVYYIFLKFCLEHCLREL